MTFPDVQRVVYGKNPLDRVICQLAYPPILKIDAEVPAVFQEKLRKDYPIFSERSEPHLEIPDPVRTRVSKEVLGQLLHPPARKNYEFSSEDGQWRLNLTRTFLAVTANEYERWETFKDRLRAALNALVEIYSPAFFSRIGLRYVDVVRRSILNLGDVPWTELLQPHVLGLLGAPEIADRVETFETRYEFRLPQDEGGGMARIVSEFVLHAHDNEKCFMIDSDFFTVRKTEVSAALGQLDYFNRQASRLIRWCIKERLHQAMEPEEL